MESRYYSQTPEQVLAAVESREEGLTSQQAQERLERFGPNALREEKKKPVWQVFLEQFKDLLVVILIAAAVISMLSGNVESTVVIFAVLILNAVLGTVQHCKAEKSLESLKAMSAPTARVLRDGERLVIPSAQIVPGDIVELEAGDMVVADGRILHNYSLKVNESSLTGESEGVEKTEAVIEGDKVALGDRKNLVFSGSLVTYGRALVVITGTGMDTELGKVAALMNQTQRRKTPLQESLDQFSRRLAMIILIICVGVFALSLYHAGSFGAQAILDSLMFAVALAVAAIPEALSSIVTIVQAMGTQKMAKENAIMKELKAVETLGAVSVICSDKTGTLTQNKMTPQTAFVDGELIPCQELTLENPIHRRLVRAAILASDATTDEEKGTAVGDPTEVALIMIGDRMGNRGAGLPGAVPPAVRAGLRLRSEAYVHPPRAGGGGDGDAHQGGPGRAAGPVCEPAHLRWGCGADTGAAGADSVGEPGSVQPGAASAGLRLPGNAGSQAGHPGG